MIEVEDKKIEAVREQKKQGRFSLRNLKELFVGGGNTFFGVNWKGLWLGAKNFEDAPFRVDMEGNVVGVSLEGTEFSGLTINSSTINSTVISGSTITGNTIISGNIATAASGLRMRMNGSTNAYEFLNNDLVLVQLRSESSLFSGHGGASLSHGAGGVRAEVSGQGVGLGSRQALFINDSNSVYFGLIDRDSGSYHIVASGLPTSASGLPTGTIWNDGGQLKIVT